MAAKQREQVLLLGREAMTRRELNGRRAPGEPQFDAKPITAAAKLVQAGRRLGSQHERAERLVSAAQLELELSPRLRRPRIDHGQHVAAAADRSRRLATLEESVSDVVDTDRRKRQRPGRAAGARDL